MSRFELYLCGSINYCVFFILSCGEKKIEIDEEQPNEDDHLRERRKKEKKRKKKKKNNLEASRKKTCTERG